ncbi:recombination protein RecR [candidate division KSB1 bacterium RBG_16_48_16]|nr:MAG: recombination protein RecR [candidate division KSB1 bacterium RBG_16_48_16]
MKYASDVVERAINEFSKLPGIGRKTAQRHVFFLLKSTDDEIDELVRVLKDLKEKVRHCSLCFNLTEVDPCPLCSNPERDRSMICVVEEPNDVVAVEKTGEFKGLYHCLGGVLSPLDGVGPDDLHIKELLARLDEQTTEVIIATNPNTEGEATALYLARLIKPLGIKISRIARGLPVGADLEYADEITLSRAFEGRISL